MEDTDTLIKVEDIGEEKVEGCLICCGEPSRAQLLSESEKKLDSDNPLDLDPQCLRSHSSSIFVLREILNYPKSECENLLQCMGGLHPGEWFRLCEDCSEVAEKVLESFKEIATLEKKIAKLRQSAGEKLEESLLWERESTEEIPTVITVSARNIIRNYFRTRLSNTTKALKVPPRSTDNEANESLNEVINNSFKAFNEDSNDAFSPDNVGDNSTNSSKEDTSSSKKIERSKNSICKKTAKARDHSPIKRRRGRPRSTSKQRIEPLICNLCPSTYSCFKTLRRHSARHRIYKIFCPICNYPAKSAQALDMHKTKMHRSTDIYFRCDKCEYESDDHKHKATHNSKHKLVDKAITRSTGSKFSCNLCNELLPNFQATYLHVRRNHGNDLGVELKPHKCPQCEKSFVLNSILRSHVRKVHEGARNLYCDTCGAGFMHQCHLSEHISALHSKVKSDRAVCEICGKSAVSEKGLQRHIRRYHGSAPVNEKVKLSHGPRKCKHCDVNVKHDVDWRNHMEAVHPELLVHQCSHCHLKFTQLWILLAHEKRKHSAS